MSYFDDILVIINFNHPHYENIPFIRNVIYKDCPNIVFYGDNISDQSYPGVSVVPQHTGAFAYRAMTDAIIKYPNYSGYFFVMDDVFLNIENLLNKDKKKVWFPEPNPNNFVNVFRPHKNDWQWGKPWGLPKCKLAWKNLPDGYRAFLQKTLGVENGFAGGFSDCFYLPASLSAKWIVVADALSKEEVFLEIAVPTILCAIQDYKQWDYLNIKDLWGFSSHRRHVGDRVRWRSFVSKKYDGIHPVKFSDIRNQNTIIWLLTEANKKSMLGMKEFIIRIYCDFVGLTDYCNIAYWLRRFRFRLLRKFKTYWQRII